MAKTENQFLLGWCKRYAQIDENELVELTKLSNLHGSIEDCRLASAIYDCSAPNSDQKWRELTGLAAIFRVGYILGQRAERKRRKIPQKGY